MKLTKNSKIITLLFSVVLIIFVLGFSYAFFIYNKTGLYTHTITGGKMKVIYDETQGNNITIENAYPRTDEEALTYGLEFEFTITGYNESEKNVYYAIEIDHGEDVADKERFLDTDMKLTLYENDEVVFENQIYDNLDNQDIHYGYIRQGTSTQLPTTNNYKLRIWINDNVIITDTPENLDITDKNAYTSDEFANRYANFKVNVKADLTYDDVGYLTYDANGGDFAPEKTSLLTNMVTTKKPVMEGKGFLGWSSDQKATTPEYLTGEYYTGEGQMLYAVYGDTRNVMSDLTVFSDVASYITEIYFINDTRENIDNRYNTALTETLAYDITLNNQGSVKAWIELSEDGNNLLYIGSEGTIYLSTGILLFTPFIVLDKIDFSNIDTSMVTDMTAMFAREGAGYFLPPLHSLSLENFNTRQVISMAYMFSGGSFSDLDLTGIDTRNVTDMSYMFSNCCFLEKIDLSALDTSKVTNMSNLFDGCTNLNNINFGRIDTSHVTDMSYMFHNCSSLEAINVNNFNTSSVTDMSGMFKDCGDLLELDLSNFDTSKVTNMSFLFLACYDIKKINLSSFDTSQVTEMYSMFAACRKLEEINVQNFNTSQVTNMTYMFNECESLKELNLSNFIVSNVNTMYGMFIRCKNLVNLDISSFVTSKVRDMSHMFSGCTSLIELDIKSFDTSSLTNTVCMFDNCENLTTIYANSDWNNGSVTSSSSMFSGCTNLVGAVSYLSDNANDITYANPDTGYFTKKEG